MEYHGKLYGKVGGKYFDTGRTSAEFDAMQKKLTELQLEKENSESKEFYIEDDEDFDYYDHDDDEPDFERFDCTCGAWRYSDKLQRFIHTADCICGSSEPF